MADVLTPEQRRFNMSRIRNRNTKPEIIVRSIVHKMGFRYRLHRKDLAGKPDLVFLSRRKIIFVHGCFFHMHYCSYGKVTPKTNAEFWQNKRLGNIERDKKNIEILTKDGWDVLVIWECMTKPRNINNLPVILENFLSETTANDIEK
jgi:DNA mismatch endonuclease (patch repair protein)